MLMASDGDSEPKRKLPRSFDQWNEFGKRGGPLDRQDEEFDMWNGLGEYSEAQCRPDGFPTSRVSG